MKKLFARFWSENDGVLSFEWVTLNSIVVLGVVGGIATVRDAVNDEMADMTEAITSLDQSYTVTVPCGIAVGRSRNGGGGVSPQINEGMGYSRQAWKEFMATHPTYSTPRIPRQMVASGAASSGFIDTKPEVDRTVNAGMTPEVMPVDQSGMIDNAQ